MPLRRAEQERDILSPWDGSLVGAASFADAAKAEQALAAAAQLHATRHPLPKHERSVILRRTAQAVQNDRTSLARQIAAEGGKPLTDALVEVDRAVNGLELAAHEAGHMTGPSIPMGATAASEGRIAFSDREPIGVVLAISAFNHPLNLIVHQVAPAVAAGCPVLAKPASSTPLSCLSLVQALHNSGLPPEWCTALPCSAEVASLLVADRRVSYLSFIGSADVGWTLRSKLAPGTRASFEHGGTAPMLIDRDADLELATALILKGGYYHAGQVCVSVQRVFADATVAEELLERLTAGISALKTGDPSLEETDVGPLISATEAVRVESWVAEAVEGGATRVAGGSRLGPQALAPILLAHAADDARVMTEEVFGPVVSLVTSRDLTESVTRANAVPWAFQAGVVTRDLDRAMVAARNLDATTVMINDHTAFRTDWMPFGGRGPSGLGLGGIAYSTHEMTEPKVVILRQGS